MWEKSICFGFLQLVRTFLYVNQCYSWMGVACISYKSCFPEGLLRDDLPHGVVKMTRVVQTYCPVTEPKFRPGRLFAGISWAAGPIPDSEEVFQVWKIIGCRASWATERCLPDLMPWHQILRRAYPVLSIAFG